MKVPEGLHEHMLEDGWAWDPYRREFVRKQNDIVMPLYRLFADRMRFETRLPTNRNRKRARCQARRRARRQAAAA